MKNRVLLKSALLLLLIAANGLVTASEVSFSSKPILSFCGTGPSGPHARTVEITGAPAKFPLRMLLRVLRDGAPKRRSDLDYETSWTRGGLAISLRKTRASELLLRYYRMTGDKGYELTFHVDLISR